MSSCAPRTDPPQQVLGELKRLAQAGTDHQVVLLAEKTLKRYPRSGRLRWILGRAQFRLGHFRETVEALGPILKDGWGGSEVYRTVGFSKLYLGRLEEAFPLLEEASRLDPSDAEIRKKMGYLNYYLGRGDAAVALFQERVEADPGDLEAFVARDALMALTGRWAAAAMVWYTEPSTGLQFCYPGGWEMKRKEFLVPSGKIVVAGFFGRAIETEDRFLPGGLMLLSVVHNASRAPLPQFPTGAFRRGEVDSEGYTHFHPTHPRAELGTRSLPREPGEIAKFLIRDSLGTLMAAWDLRVRDVKVEPWVGLRGQAAYCVGETLLEDAGRRLLYGRSMGIYDPAADTFGYLLICGPDRNRESVRQVSQAVFDLSLFGGVPGIPPVPKGYVTSQEYGARIQGFLQAGQDDRALTEALKATEDHPQEGELFALLGEAHTRLWHLEDAVKAFEKARALGDSDPRTEYRLGWVKLALGQAADAEQAFLRFLQRVPDDLNAAIGAGLAAYRQGKLEQARERFHRLAETPGPLRKVAQSSEAALDALAQGGASDRMWWYRPLDQSRRLFCVPADWESYEAPQEGGLVQVFFTPESLEEASEDFNTGMIYVRYEAASARVGKIRKEDIRPHEVVDGFLRQAFERVGDPQKVWQELTPLFHWGRDRYGFAGYAYTHHSRRRVVRTLCYYEPGKDRLHVLNFRTTVSDLGDWAAFVETCFQLADFAG